MRVGYAICHVLLGAQAAAASSEISLKLVHEIGSAQVVMKNQALREALLKPAPREEAKVKINGRGSRPPGSTENAAALVEINFESNELPDNAARDSKGQPPVPVSEDAGEPNDTGHASGSSSLYADDDATGGGASQPLSSPDNRKLATGTCYTGEHSSPLACSSYECECGKGCTTTC